jgi:hypothetical protein
METFGCGSCKEDGMTCVGVLVVHVLYKVLLNKFIIVCNRGGIRQSQGQLFNIHEAAGKNSAHLRAFGKSVPHLCACHLVMCAP